MSNSIRFAMQEHGSVPEGGLFSTDATRRAIEQEFIGRVVTQLRVRPQGSPAGRVREIVEALDAGRLDRVIEQFAPDTAPAAAQRFDDVPEFDYDAWRRRHG
jgi:hypothetical protein